MNIIRSLLALGLVMPACLPAQETFAVTGTAVPTGLLRLNYGTLPKGIDAYDLNICNLTEARESITSSEIFQALAQTQSGLRPIGRQIMLAAILRNRNHSVRSWLTLALNSSATVLSILGTTRAGMPSKILSRSALGAIIGQQLLTTLSPILTADQVQKFETEVLETALVMDGGSCVERTVFTAADSSRGPALRHAPRAAKPASLDFRVR